MLIHLPRLLSPRFKDFVKVLNFSGGKDSLYLLYNYTKMFDVVLFADTGYEHPETYLACSLARQYCQMNNIKFVWLHATQDFFDLASKYGVPNKVCRWCNSQLKVKPIHRFLDKHYGSKVINIIGYTADEVERSQKKFVECRERLYCFPLIDDNIHEATCRQFAIDNRLYTSVFMNTYRHSNCIVCPFMWDEELPHICESFPDVAFKMARLNQSAKYKYRYSLSHILQDFLDKHVSDPVSEE